MKKIVACLATALIVATIGCVNPRAQIPKGTLTISMDRTNIPYIVMNNETGYRLPVDIHGFSKVFHLYPGENQEHLFKPTPSSSSPWPKSLQVKIIAWNEDLFPVGSASRQFPIIQPNGSGFIFTWKIAKQDLEY